MWALFEEVVKSLPNAPAVQFETSAPWSYEELHKSASKFAEQLQRVVKSGQHVAVMLERSPAQVASILAIAKIGAVYVPVDHNLREQGSIALLRASRIASFFATQTETPS